MPTCRSSVDGLAARLLAGAGRHAAAGPRAIWPPIVMTGSRWLDGSWKIMPMPRPRQARISASGSARSRARRNSTSPPAIARVEDGSSRIRPRQTMVLPEPLSPTRPRISPRAEIEARRRRRCAARRPSTASPRTDSSVAHSRAPSTSPRPSPSRLKPKASSNDGEARESGDPPGRGDEALPLGDHHAPFGRRRLNAEAEIADRGARSGSPGRSPTSRRRAARRGRSAGCGGT